MGSFSPVAAWKADCVKGVEEMALADIHTHMLFGVDDGARSEEEMYGMIDQAYQSGTRIICFTPHFHPGYWGDHGQQITQTFQRLKEGLRTSHPELRVYLGNELRYAPECIDWLESGDCRTLNQTRYVLVDFSEAAPEKRIGNGLDRLLNAGYVPILAHAERYRALHGNSRLIQEYRDNGVIIQADAQSLFRGFGFSVRRQCKRLLANGLIDLFSSDAHDCSSRPPDMKDCFDYIAKKYGKSCAGSLCWDTAGRILCGEAVRKDYD